MLSRLMITLFALFPVMLIAHPHSFLDMKNQVQFEGDTLTGFKMSWQLDEISSAELIYELRSSNNKAAALAKLTKELDQSTVQNHYFSELYNQRDEAIKFQAQPSQSSIEIKDNRIIYHFTLKLAHPQAVTGQSFRLFTFEPSYYLYMSYASAEDVTQTPQPLCSVKMEEAKINQSLKLYASKLDKSEKPDLPSGSLSLGAQFAQKVNILCLAH
ncbi:ABC transporter substrate-binding protein [Pasteurellaceae bacterium Macca]|nr:ABC transporter substrate-binding protein [Pasteurellaceae bacterium Macca]